VLQIIGGLLSSESGLYLVTFGVLLEKGPVEGLLRAPLREKLTGEGLDSLRSYTLAGLPEASTVTLDMLVGSLVVIRVALLRVRVICRGLFGAVDRVKEWGWRELTLRRRSGIRRATLSEVGHSGSFFSFSFDGGILDDVLVGKPEGTAILEGLLFAYAIGSREEDCVFFCSLGCLGVLSAHARLNLSGADMMALDWTWDIKSHSTRETRQDSNGLNNQFND